MAGGKKWEAGLYGIGEVAADMVIVRMKDASSGPYPRSSLSKITIYTNSNVPSFERESLGCD